MNIRQDLQATVASDSYICPACQADNRLTAKFCRRCGQPRTDFENNVVQIAGVVQQPVVASSTQKASRAFGCECLKCFSRLRATDTFCSWCGETQVLQTESADDSNGASQARHSFCHECSKQLPDQANFCFSCGIHVGVNKRLKVRVPANLFHDEDSEFFPIFDA